MHLGSFVERMEVGVGVKRIQMVSVRSSSLECAKRVEKEQRREVKVDLPKQNKEST